jgi:P-type conjugative transfer protein TrbJ
MRRTLKKLRSLALTAAIIPMIFAAPAHAIFGFGDIVIDPTNLIQNALTATRTLQQVTDQARMLRNQVTQMTRLGIYVGEDFERTLSDLNRLTHQARGLTYRIDEIERVFEMHFPDAYADWSVTEQAQIADAQQDAAIMAFRDSIQMQAQITQAIEQDSRQLNVLMNASQGSAGQLSAVQAGNQITALSAKQTMQMQTLMAAQYRAEAIERSRALYAEQAGAARHEAFMGRGG